MPEVTLKSRQKWLRRLLPALLVVVAALVLLGLAARTPQVREYAGREATRLIREEVGLMATIAEVDVDAASFSVVGRGIKLDHPEHGDWTIVV